MKKTIVFGALLMLIMGLCSFVNVTDEDVLANGVDQNTLNEMKQDSIKGKAGVVNFPACHASVNVPDGFVFLDSIQARTLLIDYWGNPEDRAEGLLGVLVPNTALCYYQISMAYIISYDNCGYVKDDDASSIDYDDLLADLKKKAEAESDTLPKENRYSIKGWAVSPKYLADSHVLVWAKTLSFSGEDIVNYDMRILGKDGLVSINAVIDPADCKEVVASESKIIDCLTYDNGYAYTDFDASRDRVSEWTIGGLVAGTILAKTGVLAKIGIFLLKFWKIIAVAVASAVSGIVWYFKKKKEEEEFAEFEEEIEEEAEEETKEE